MKSRLLAAALLAALCGSPLGAQTSSEPSFGEVVEVTVVNIDVYVTDKDGNRVTGLKKEDFVVLEDGKPVQITNFEAFQGRSAPAVSASPRVPAAPAVPERTVAPPANPESGLSLVVFVDNLHLRPDNRTRALEQIRKFLAANVRPGDRVMLVSHGLGLRTRQAFTDDPAALDAALKEIAGLPAFGVQAATSRNEALRTMLALYGLEGCAEDVVDPIEAYAQQMRNEALQTVGALTLMVNSLSGVPGRKAVLYVSDGVPVTPGEELFQALYELCSGGAERAGISISYLGEKIGAADLPGNGDSGSTNAAGTSETFSGSGYSAPQALLDAQSYSLVSQFAELAAHANAHRVTFYTLQASGLTAHTSASDGSLGAERITQMMSVRQAETASHQGSLTAMAADTGGRAILNVNDFLPALAGMQEDFSNYYSLGYNPSQLGQGKQHRLEVKLKRPGLRVRYRHSYRDKSLMERMVDRTLAALLHGLEDNPLQVAVNIGDQIPGEDGKFSVPVQLKIPIFKLALINQNETYQGKLRLLVATQDAKGANSPVRQVEVPLSIPRKEVLNAMGQYYLYTLTLKMPPGGQRVAVAVHDQVSAYTSYLSRPVTVGETVAAGAPVKP